MGPNRIGPIGVHLGGRWIAVAQVARAHKGDRLLTSAVIERPEPGEPVSQRDIARLEGVLDRRGFRGTRVALAAPEDLAFSSVLELPPRSSGAPIEQIARAEMARIHQVDADAFRMGSWDLPSSQRARQSTSVLAVGATHASMGTLVDLFEPLGFEIAFIEPRCCALGRACQAVLAEPTEVIIDLGWNASRLLLTFNGVIAYERALAASGVARLDQTLRDHLETETRLLDHVLATLLAEPSAARDRRSPGRSGEVREFVREWALRIAREADGAAAYAERQFAAPLPTRILLTGPGTAIAGIDETIGELSGIPARSLAAGDLVPCRPETASDARLATAIGVARRFR